MVEPGSSVGGPGKKWIIILVIILVLVIIGIGLWLIFKKPVSEVSVPPSGSGGARDNVAEDLKEKEEVSRPVRYGKMSLVSEDTNLKVGDNFLVDIVLDTQDSNIVLAKANIKYNPKVLELVEANEANSVLSMSIINDSFAGQIEIIRGEPGDANYDDVDDGYNGKDGILATLEFEILAKQNIQINFDEENSSMILDDGRGTPMILEYENLNLNIN